MSFEAIDADFEFVDTTVEDSDDRARVGTITIERPDARNALNETVRKELIEAVEAAEDDEEVRVLVLTGSEDGGAFIAGADITEFRERDHIEQRERSQRPRVYEAFADATVPVVAAINGHALGGGCEVAQACDIRIAKAGTMLGQPEVNLGLIPGGGGTQRLPDLVGEGQAMKLILSGEPIDAEEAADIGLVEAVHAANEFEERVYDLAAGIAEKSPLALQLIKESVRAGSKMGRDEGLDYEIELFSSLFGSHDMKEGIDAFFDDRKPEFEGH